MWVECSERLPGADGEYRVIRRSMGGRPSYEDTARFTRAFGSRYHEDRKPAWQNRGGVVIRTVERWWDDAEHL